MIGSAHDVQRSRLARSITAMKQKTSVTLAEFRRLERNSNGAPVMELLQLRVWGSTLLCSFVAGFVLCFAIIIMPGIKTLGALDFLKSFKAMDGII